MYNKNIEQSTLKNKNYRKVVHTDENIQIVLMSLNPGENIPLETHDGITQFFRIEQGTGYAKIGNKKILLKDGIAFTIPSGVKHYIKQTGLIPLKLYSIYSPPNHESNRIDKRQPLE